MLRVYDSLTQLHDLSLVAVAAAVCAFGSTLTAMVLRRMLAAKGARRQIQTVMCSLISGTTIWATHFIGMLAYDPAVAHGFDPFLTGVSLAIAILGALMTNIAMGLGKKSLQYISAGTIFGLTVSAMHYAGVAALIVAGETTWDMGMVAASIILGIILSVASFHRVVYPVTRICWLGGALLMAAAICVMHFTGMSAFSITPNPTILVPPQVLPDIILGMLITAIVTLIFFVGFSSISIETNIEREAFTNLEHVIVHDQLTGLPNRMHLKQALDTLSDNLMSGATVGAAAITIDIDNFKLVNDLHGQEAGDAVLQVIAARLLAAIRPGEFISRIAGDQFVALISDIASEKDALAFANRINLLIQKVVSLENCAVAVSASLGIATSFHDGLAPNELVQKSDHAMFRAKQNLDDRICIYDAELDQQLRDKLTLINDLRSALDGNQLSLVYQLQNETQTENPVGCEALLRWEHPEKGNISPAVFIPLAEESGLINDIGAWVLRTACFEAASWEQPWSIAINVAPQQLLQPTLLQDLASALSESGFPASRLELEITEASVIHDQTNTLKVLNKIKSMGIRIAMDDFGTGYSSLATLQTFPFDQIKIDRSFVTDIHQDKHRAAIVRSTLSLGEAFGISVLAEGVETAEELNFLKAAGCNFVQGFYFGKPMSTENVRRLTMIEKTSLAS